MIVLNILLIIIWMIVVPYLIGELVSRVLHLQEGKGIVYVTGMLSMFAVFQCIAIPMTFLYAKLTTLVLVFGSIMMLLILLLIIIYRKDMLKSWSMAVRKPFRPSIWMVLPIALIVFQAVIAAYMDIPYYNYDDAWYLGVTTTSVDTNTIMRYNAYTGNEYTAWPTRYILSPFPVFQAVISKLVCLHPATLAHVVFPLLFIPISYIIYAAIGRLLFLGDRKRTGIFITLVCLLNAFANYSWFTPGTFLLVRIWQGKAQLANVILPFIFYLGACAVLKNDKYKYWSILFITMLAGVMMTSMGVYLSPFALGVIVLIYAVRYKNPGFILKGLLSVSPCILFGVLYLMMR